jgi:acyl-CoA synthetase (AMP-forming)/AMP-acid ligase II
VTLFPGDIFDLASIVRDVAGRDPGRDAVVEPAGRNQDGSRRYRRYSYGQLSADAEAIAPGLRELGIAERTRTVFMAPPSYEACVAGVALTRVGATTLWIDPSVGYRNVGERLRRIEPEAFVGIALAHAGRVAFGWGARWPRKAVVVGGGLFPGARALRDLRRTPPREPAPPAVAPEDPVAVLYTTGSTGAAKPALYRHRDFAHVYRIAHASWRFAEHPGVPVDLAVFPAFAFIVLSAGGTAVVPPIDFRREGPADVDPAAMLQVINDCGVTSMFASPVILENLGRHARACGARMPSLRRVIGGGAPIVASTVQALGAMLPEGAEVAANYGATEALPSTEIGPAEILATAERTARGAGICVGRPFAGVAVRVVRPVDGDVGAGIIELPPGVVGEIAIAGAHVSPEYLGDAANTRANKTRAADGTLWHRTGDAGYVDADGRLWCCGRLGQRVRTAAGDLHPLQCEPIFDAHPRVRRSGLVGVGPAGLQLPVVCIELDEPAGRVERAHLRDDLLARAAAHPTTSAIRDVLFRNRLPVDPRHNSKIDRAALARWAAGRVAELPAEQAAPKAQARRVA